jgi:hypothetical protein
MTRWKLGRVACALALLASACASATPDAKEDAVGSSTGSSTAGVTAEADATNEPSMEELPNPDELELGSPTLNDPETCDADVVFPPRRTDVRVDGNRLAEGVVDLEGPTLEVPLPGTAEWIVADPSSPGGWYVSLADGRAIRVSADGATTDAGAAPLGPPELMTTGEPRSPFANHALFSDPLVDTRVVRSGEFAVALAGPTDRYGHGVLGDAIEASAIVFANLCTNERGRIDIAEPDVIEGVAPLLGDLDGDGELEILVTLSNASEGARLAVYEFSGTLLAESEPIGRGNRWRNQLAIAPFGPAGEIEVVDVRTPHIGGTVQAFQLAFGEDGARLERVAASDDRYTSHVIGSGNLDMGVAVDANGDGRPDVVVPSSDRRLLVALTRTSERQGWARIADLSLSNPLTTNLAVQTIEGRTTLAAGVGDAVLVVG